MSTMVSYLWPLALVVLSDTCYHICARSSPADMDPLAALTVTYLVGAAGSLVLFFVLNRDGSLIAEYRKLNWAPLVLGIVIIGLEVGCMYAYRAGWQVNTFGLVKGVLLAVVLIFVGKFLYQEALSWNKVVGLVFCVTGLVFLNIQ